MAIAKQKRAIRVLKEALEKGEKITGGQVLERAGYVETENPGRTFSRDSFLEKLEEAIPDELALSVHKQLLKSERLRVLSVSKKVDVVKLGVDLSAIGCRLLGTGPGIFGNMSAFVAEPVDESRKHALDMLYKIKGRYAPVKIQGVDPIDGATLDQLEREAEEKREIVERFKKYPAPVKKKAKK